MGDWLSRQWCRSSKACNDSSTNWTENDNDIWPNIFFDQKKSYYFLMNLCIGRLHFSIKVAIFKMPTLNAHSNCDCILLIHRRNGKFSMHCLHVTPSLGHIVIRLNEVLGVVV